jgi:inhibitor of cysteine peptidase
MTPTTGAASTTTTDSSGVYTFPMPALGNYTITPGNANYGFTPNQSTISVTSATTGRAAINFAATSSYSISGTVSGGIAGGVSVILYNAGSGAPITATTDANGYYKFSGLSSGSFTVIPNLPGYTFSPSNSIINISGSSTSGNNYTATANGSAPITNASISGTVSGAVTQGVTVKLYSTSSSTPQTTTTDASGFYMFTGLTNGTYTVIPSLGGFSFNPSTSTVGISGASVTGTNYSAVAGTTVTTNNSLSGTVSGNIKAGVTIILHTPGGQISAVTDATGYYEFTGLSNGTYTVIPTLTGYSFNPANTIVNIAGASTAGTNFVSLAGIVTTTNTLSGIISGEVTQGITVNLYGRVNSTATSDVNGYYQFTGLDDGSYTVIPTANGVAFTPGNLVVTVAGTTATANDFTTVKTLHTISGTVPGLAGANLTLAGVSSATATTDALGNYAFPNLANGKYTITPLLAGYTFNPTASGATLNSANIAGLNFTPTYIIIPTYTISGHVTNRRGLVGNTIQLSGTANASTMTDTSGYYQFTGLVSGEYTVTPTSAYPNVTYKPSASTFSLIQDRVVDFSGFDTININITRNTASLVDTDVKTILIAAGWDSVTPIYSNITIDPNVNLYASSSGNAALTIKGIFPAESQITITNNGNIVGYGGAGGTGGGCMFDTNTLITYNNPAGPGYPGGTGLSISSSATTIIVNNGLIAGGGNGGAGTATNQCPWNTWAYGTVGGVGAGRSGLLTPIGNGFALGNSGAATSGAANATWNALGTLIGAQN